MKIKSFLLLCFLLIPSLYVSAVEMRIDEDFYAESNQYREDYLFFGNHLNFLGRANDLFFLGEILEFKGDTDLSITAAAREIHMSGSTGNGVKAGARIINISGKSKGTNFLGAEKVNFEEGSEINGDSFVGARKLAVKGKMTGDLYAGAGEVTIENEINGNVEVHTGKLIISEQGKINGNLIYHSDQQLTDEELARVTGDVKFEKNEGGHFDDTLTDDYSDESIWFSLFFKLAFAVLGFLLLLFPATRVLEQKIPLNDVLTHSLWGLIPIFIYPSAIVISILLIVTIPVGLALLLAFVPVLFITKMVGITAIGGLLVKGFNLSSNSRFLYFLLGVLIYSLLSFIPYFGFLLMIFVSSIGCGVILFALFDKKIATRY